MWFDILLSHWSQERCGNVIKSNLTYGISFELKTTHDMSLTSFLVHLHSNYTWNPNAKIWGGWKASVSWQNCNSKSAFGKSYKTLNWKNPLLFCWSFSYKIICLNKIFINFHQPAMSVKFELSRIESSQDINVLKDVAKEKC